MYLPQANASSNNDEIETLFYAGDDEKQKYLDTTGVSVNWYRHFGRQFVGV